MAIKKNSSAPVLALAPVLKLVPPTVSRDTVEMLASALPGARDGKTIGAVLITLHPGGHFSIYLAGEAHNDPVRMRGILCKLDDLFASMER